MVPAVIVDFEQYTFKDYVEYSLKGKETIVRGYRFLKTDTLIGIIQFQELEVSNIAILNAKEILEHKVEKNEHTFMSKLLSKKGISGVFVPDEMVNAKSYFDVFYYCANQKLFAVLEGVNDDDFDVVEFMYDQENNKLICRGIYSNGEADDEWFEFNPESPIVSATIFDTYAGNLQTYISNEASQKLKLIE